MPFPAPTGSVYLNNIQFSTNPETYDILNWRKRQSITAVIGGKVVIQDFGVYMKDNTIKLASGNAQFLDQATFLAFHALWRTRGATYSFTDWLNNSFTVFIKEFLPIVFKTDLYRYSMDLQVTQIITFWGVPYTGA
jgi:hypothetical protein